MCWVYKSAWIKHILGTREMLFSMIVRPYGVVYTYTLYVLWTIRFHKHHYSLIWLRKKFLFDISARIGMKVSNRKFQVKYIFHSYPLCYSYIPHTKYRHWAYKLTRTPDTYTYRKTKNSVTFVVLCANRAQRIREHRWNGTPRRRLTYLEMATWTGF